MTRPAALRNGGQLGDLLMRVDVPLSQLLLRLLLLKIFIVNTRVTTPLSHEAKTSCRAVLQRGPKQDLEWTPHGVSWNGQSQGGCRSSSAFQAADVSFAPVADCHQWGGQPPGPRGPLLRDDRGRVAERLRADRDIPGDHGAAGGQKREGLSVSSPSCELFCSAAGLLSALIHHAAPCVWFYCRLDCIKGH
jgi:hypothetical protein